MMAIPTTVIIAPVTAEPALRCVVTGLWKQTSVRSVMTAIQSMATTALETRSEVLTVCGDGVIEGDEVM